jgi:acetyl-CoA C-acetyltransferase
MSFSGKIAIAGVHEYESRWCPDKTTLQITGECAREALADAGLELSDVDGLFGATMSMGAMGIVQMAEYLNIKPRYLDGSNIGGSSFLSHVAHAAAAIHSGLCDVALILYGSTAASDAMAIGTGDSNPRGDASAAFVAPYGVPLVASYAMVAQRHMHQYGTTPEQLADIAVSTRHHASLNPHAKMQQPITREDVLSSRLIADPLHLLDCCIISDGGGAVVVTSLERARDLKQPPVVLLGTGESVCHREIGAPDLTTIAAKQSGEHAFAMAN